MNDPTTSETTPDTPEIGARPEAADSAENSRASAPADSALPDWLTSLPDTLRPYAALARLDRPIGTWLVMLPALASLAYTRMETGFAWIDIWWDVLIIIGAVTMRGAACTWNDITDKDFDGAVARTANRPLPAGEVTVTQAYIGASKVTAASACSSVGGARHPSATASPSPRSTARPTRPR